MKLISSTKSRGVCLVKSNKALYIDVLSYLCGNNSSKILSISGNTNLARMFINFTNGLEFGLSIPSLYHQKQYELSCFILFLFGSRSLSKTSVLHIINIFIGTPFCLKYLFKSWTSLIKAAIILYWVPFG